MRYHDICETVARHRATLAATSFLILFLACPGSSLAASRLNVISTNGASFTTTADVSIKDAGGTAELPNAETGVNVRIAATFQPDASHVGQRADLFTVVREGNVWYMRNLSGAFVPWSTRVADLVPAREDVLLTNGLTFDIYAGNYASAGTKRIFVGYMLAGTTFLVYTPIAALFDIREPHLGVSNQDYFTNYIETEVVQRRCIVCHVPTGLAKDSALRLQRSGTDSATLNLAAFRTLVEAKGVQHILTKVAGGNAHGGAVQLPAGSAGYEHLATLLGRLAGGGGGTPINDFLDGIVLQTPAETVRRASIMLASRAPTNAELAAVSQGDESTLRSTLRNLLQGEGFHKFLLDGTNDRLLLEGIPGEVLSIQFGRWQTFVQFYYNLVKQDVAAGKSLYQANYDGGRWRRNFLDYGFKRSAGELVAYIAENDRSYKEVVTADYMMLNPYMNLVVNGGATFSNQNDRDEFRPGRIQDYFLYDNIQVQGNDQNLNLPYIITPSQNRIPWKHAGLLNNPAFLTRYPSTATNRNRARARWTFFHFLDLDIEKSVQRPTDPAALADRNNPTLKNPACSACHELMDPVAGAFQNYGDTGFYRDELTDALDPHYKKPPDGSPTLYEFGDLWYRDMRPPGLLGGPITTTDEALRDLGQRIAQDPAFARATVKFWWPSVFNAEVLLAPTVTTDADYQAHLSAYQAQAAAIEQLAAGFMSDYNLKNLLVEMMMSPWFRARSSSSTDKQEAYLLAGLASRQLLTPERLSRKTQALTGYRWGYTTYPDPLTPWESNLETRFRGLYGGIDSLTVTKRQRDLTALMSTVAQSFALESACPIVVREFTLPDARRRLFGGITATMTPITNEAQIKQKLVQLEKILLGNVYTVDSPRITQLYKLFVDTWQEKKQNGQYSLGYPMVCDWTSDHTIFADLPPPVPLRDAGNGVWGWSFQPDQYLQFDDPQAIKLTWVVVIAYFLGHYQYLHE